MITSSVHLYCTVLYYDNRFCTGVTGGLSVTSATTTASPRPPRPPDCTPEDQVLILYPVTQIILYPGDQKIDCSELGAGWHPDAFNCRRYWHCLKENSEPEHLLCDLVSCN